MFLKVVGKLQTIKKEEEEEVKEEIKEVEIQFNEENEVVEVEEKEHEKEQEKHEKEVNSSIYTLSVSTSVDQIFEYFPGKEEIEIREELIETNEGEILEIKLTNSDIELGNLQIAVDDIYSKENWLLITSGLSLSIDITVVERVPKNWFDTGLEILTTPRPWYFKAEDIYSLIKHILDEYKISTSYPVVEFCRLVDYASLTVGKHLLSLRLDEGFSLVSQIDDLLDSLLASADKSIDSRVLQLVLSLQQLRKAITRRIREVSFFTQEKLYMLKAQTSNFAERASQGYGTLDSAFVWALETTENKTNSFKNDIFQRIQSLRDAGRASIAAVQNQIYARINAHVTVAHKSLFDISAIAHPYVIGAVEATQPYINGALVTATPLIQTIREKTPVENWINGTKVALESNTTVGPYVVAATQALEEVKNYCTDQQYFEHQQQATTVEVVATNISEN